MTSEPRTIELDFELEADDGQADLPRIAAALRDSTAAMPGVTSAQARIPGTTRNLDIDPVTVGTVLLTIQIAIKGADDVISSLDDLVSKLKDLSRNLGLPRLWVWLHTKRIDTSNLTTEQLEQLADESTSQDT
jgi:hypothetical protein